MKPRTAVSSACCLFLSPLVSLLVAQQPHWTFPGTGVRDALGSSVATAGDVDGDGYDDVIVGVPGDDINGTDSGSAWVYSGQSSLPLYQFTGAAAYDGFGFSVGGAGDVNGDGFADLIVGAPGRDFMAVSPGYARLISGRNGVTLQTFQGAAVDDWFGFSVAGAGDIDGDGYDDVVIGAPQNPSGRSEPGYVQAFSGVDYTLLHGLTGPFFSTGFGWSVDGAGDTNRDGKDDLVVGAPYLDRMYVYSGDTGTTLRAFAGTPGAEFGWSVSGAGDVNDDGYDDVITGGRLHASVGRVEVFSGLGGGVLHTFDGASMFGEFGFCVAGAGDVNGDGHDDVIVGSPWADYAGRSSGRAEVFSGDTGDLLYTFDGGPEDRLGWSVAGAGDVNRDGYAGLIVGAPNESTPALLAGQALVYAIKPYDRHAAAATFDGLVARDRFGFSVANCGDYNGDGTPDMVVGAPAPINPTLGYAQVRSGVDGTVLQAFWGDLHTDEFGHSVDGAGDVNGDTISDLVVGAPGDDDGGTSSGRVTVFSPISGGTTLFVFDGDDAHDMFGWCVRGAGDVNQDGFDDVFVGAPGDDDNGLDCGSARLLSGLDGTPLRTFFGNNGMDAFGYAVDGAGDVNGDTYPDLIAGARFDDDNGRDSGSARLISGVDYSVLQTFLGDDPGDQFGSAVAAAGDVNADGYADIIVGAPGDDDNGEYSGSARVFSGLDYSILHTFYGDSAGDAFGAAVGGAGDVNGDGHDDLIVGALRDDNNGTDSGSARLFSGADGSILHTFDGDDAGDEFGNRVAGAGDTNGDGLADVIVGAYRDDNTAADSGSARLFESSFRTNPGAFRTYLAGCPGSDGYLPRIGSASRPVLGGAFGVTLRSAPTWAPAVLNLGGNRVDIDLGFMGAPGCRLGTLPILSRVAFASSTGFAQIQLAIPNDPSLLGGGFNVQWACIDTRANPLGVILSDGGLVTIGKP